MGSGSYRRPHSTRLGGAGCAAGRVGSSAVAAVILLGLWLYLVNGALIVGYKHALMRAEAPAWRDRDR
jgi:hypothetical protein